MTYHSKQKFIILFKKNFFLSHSFGERRKYCGEPPRTWPTLIVNEVELLKSRQNTSLKRRVRQTLLRRVYGSQKLASIRVQWKMPVCTKTTASTGYKLNFSFSYRQENTCQTRTKAAAVFERCPFGFFWACKRNLGAGGEFPQMLIFKKVFVL